MSPVRRRRQKKTRKNTVILLAILLVFVLIIIVAVSQSPPKSKEPADKYFEIFEATVNYGEFQDPPEDEGGSYQNSSALIIYDISFKIRAIGGDAHNVVVGSWAKVPEVYFEEILKDQSAYYSEFSQAPFGYLSRKDKEVGKFPFEVRIRSSEAEGTITIYL